ncbi:hypothetical protein [Sphingomonas sp. IC081]|uniref:hypothetical protein n=1 Tax=Sphingomonas sp. IC081 TaxID=304378 RepID=UPI00115C1BE9|nr:hypothetical protein [Sphingomonas sp. IC081]QDK36031.1 hypothetical protein DM450_0175 [Sphingomonas sp. IC081]
MKALIFTALGALALSGCTGSHIKPPAVCDGKHRRPANMYGTIMPNLPVPLPPSQTAGWPATPASSPSSDTPIPPEAQEAAAAASAAKSAPDLSPRDKREIELSYLPCS